jgi:hypothetical protein
MSTAHMHASRHFMKKKLALKTGFDTSRPAPCITQVMKGSAAAAVETLLLEWRRHEQF